jgi:diadenosine tetraphosphate (Ap4A) HIT family hydrolase
MGSADCPFCHDDGLDILWRGERCRVVQIHHPDHPGYCQVLWNVHVREWSDLAAADRAHCLAVVTTVEEALRALLAPDKINLAAFGNLVPHLHWHVVARFRDDAHWPDPIWAQRRREGMAHQLDRAQLERELELRLRGMGVGQP